MNKNKKSIMFQIYNKNMKLNLLFKPLIPQLIEIYLTLTNLNLIS